MAPEAPGPPDVPAWFPGPDLCGDDVPEAAGVPLDSGLTPSTPLVPAAPLPPSPPAPKSKPPLPPAPPAWPAFRPSPPRPPLPKRKASPPFPPFAPLPPLPHSSPPLPPSHAVPVQSAAASIPSPIRPRNGPVYETVTPTRGASAEPLPQSVVSCEHAGPKTLDPLPMDSEVSENDGAAKATATGPPASRPPATIAPLTARLLLRVERLLCRPTT